MKQSVFITRVRSILNDNEGQRWHPAQRYGTRLDEPRLALVPAGSDRVFRRPAERLFPEYHVAIYVDVSGSMSGNKMIQAVGATHALWYAMKKAGCKVSVHGFANRTGEATSKAHDAEALYAHLPMMGLGGGTEDYVAIKDGERRLAGQRGGKIVFVVSDGESGDGEKLKATLVEARRAGVTVLSIGIGTSGVVAEMYGHQWAADVTEVARTYGVMAGLLERQYRRG